MVSDERCLNHHGRCCRLHILIAEAFVEKSEGKDIVNCKKGKKHDCRASQLEWVTQSENIKHAWDLGLCRCNSGVKESGSRKTV
jgi:hypothetical protein